MAAGLLLAASARAWVFPEHRDIAVLAVQLKLQKAAFADMPLIAHFAALDRSHTRLGVAGKIMDAATAQRWLDAGVAFVLIGRGAMLHHDFARRALADAGFCSAERPVTRSHLQAEGLGPAFLDYVASTWPRFMVEGWAGVNVPAALADPATALRTAAV